MAALKKRQSNPAITLTEAHFAVAESYKTIRTNLLFLLSQNPGCKVITVSSAKAGDGKTTNVINIAIAFSQIGKRVLLIDADLRRPAVAKTLHIENSIGLSGILAGFNTISEAIVNISPNLDVLPTGSIPPNLSELLASTAFDRMFESLRLAYDYILIDTPPAGIVSDAVMIAPKTDGLVLVIKSKSTTHTEFERLIDNIKLADIRILGTVLNATVTEDSYYHYKRVY